MMAVLVFLLLILGFTAHASATWCICKDGSDAVLQKTLDYACGAGADCSPIHANGGCYNPNTVRAHCNYAVNSYFQKKGQAQGTCDFAGTAAITTTDPSANGCTYPSSASAAGTTTPTTGTTNSPTTTNPSTTTPTTTTTPYTTTPSTGVLGGVGAGVGPSGASTNINTDYSHGGLRLEDSGLLPFFMILSFSGLIRLWD